MSQSPSPEKLTLSVEGDPGPADIKAVEEGLSAHAEAQGLPFNWKPVGVFLRDEAGAIRAGLIGRHFSAYDSFFVEMLWTDERLRGQGLGARLLAAAEDEARDRGCKVIYLDTYSFQAPDFYSRHGYVPFGMLAFPGTDLQRTYFSKAL